MNKSILAFSITMALTAPAFATDSYTIDPNHTYPVFEVNHLGFTTQRGRFDKTSGKIKLDIAAKSGSVELSIDTKSLDMGSSKWNEHLSADGFFNVEKFPSITFKSNKLIFEGEKVVAAEGDFTLLGVTNPLKLKVNSFKCGENPITKKLTCGGDVTATLMRSEFGMTKYVPAVGDEVKISVPVEAVKD